MLFDFFKKNPDVLKAEPQWNFISFGITADGKEIGWSLNNLLPLPEDYKPVTSILIYSDEKEKRLELSKQIIKHVNQFSDNLQLFIADTAESDLAEYNGRGIFGNTHRINAIADTIVLVKQTMMNRFKLMEKFQVNSIYKVKTEVDYYQVNGKEYQFDAFIELNIDATDTFDGKMYLPIADIYEGLQNDRWEGKHPKLDGVALDKDSIQKTKGEFKATDIVILIGSIDNVTTNENYTLVNTIKETLGSMGRLGRVAGIHLALVTSSISCSGGISTDLWNNIGMKVAIGNDVRILGSEEFSKLATLDGLIQYGDNTPIAFKL